MAYQVTLTASQYTAMPWFEQRGYFPPNIMRESEETWDEFELSVTLSIPEHVAWELTDMAIDDPHALYSCMSPELVQVWMDLENRIV